ncbi:hypothetical protein F4821DRAFT_245732 [Hypoxylon rubiginosum]|uniref:Uncharacterized protein n=1 Tax=Hypoxylon rubiginosum TaxID=110542 RepID=A0ACC0CRL6_9PEZI|nr:hypothetical protein F4821DRAFT_245732 [Hypoxylon rubiginosum]
MSHIYKGACLCGDVRLTISAEPKSVLSCFCNDCSKGAGGTNQVIAKFSAKAVEITAKPDSISKYIVNGTSSGSPKEKAFCRTCGCPLWTVPQSAKGELLLIRTSILENGLDLRPASEIFVRSRPSWVLPSHNTTQWDEMRKG